MHNFQRTLQLDSVAMDRGGDFCIVFTEYDGGFPAEQRVPNWRIGTLGGETGEVNEVMTTKQPDGTLWGDGKTPTPLTLAVPLRINNGVISNSVGRPLYLRIRTDQGDTIFGATDMEYVGRSRERLPTHLQPGILRTGARPAGVHGQREQAPGRAPVARVGTARHAGQ